MKRLLLALALLASACGGPPPPAGPSSSAEGHSTSGTIAEVRDGGRVLVIAHGEIPGYMRAMTMPFEVDEKARDGALKQGDAVEFTFVDEDGKRVIKKLTKK